MTPKQAVVPLNSLHASNLWLGDANERNYECLNASTEFLETRERQLLSRSRVFLLLPKKCLIVLLKGKGSSSEHDGPASIAQFSLKLDLFKPRLYGIVVCTELLIFLD